MRILQVVHNFIPYNMAGTEVYTYRLSKELSKRNEVFVVFRTNDPKQKEFSLIKNNLEGLKTYAINHTLSQCNSFREMYDNKEIDKIFSDLLDKIKPDVVHIQHLLFLSLGIVKEAKQRGIPVIFVLNDYWLICQRGQLLKNDLTVCQNYNKADCLSCLASQLNVRKNTMFLYGIFRRRLPNILLQLIKGTYFAFAKIFFSTVDKLDRQIQERYDYVNKIIPEIDIFIAPSEFIKERFIEFGIPREKIIVSSYGIDYNGLYSARKTHSDKIRFGFIGTLLPLKGIEVLISAFKKVKNKDTQLFIYGKTIPYAGYESYHKRLRKMVHSDTKMKLMGDFDNKEIGRVMSDIDVLIVPSIWLENSPLVIQEAFLSKTPVVASRIGGIPELVKDGINGFLLKPADIDCLRERLEYIINNPCIITEFRENMPKIKSIEEDAQEMEKIYRSLSGERLLSSNEAFGA